MNTAIVPVVLKFWIQDDTGRSTNLFYVDNVGFTTKWLLSQWH